MSIPAIANSKPGENHGDQRSESCHNGRERGYGRRCRRAGGGYQMRVCHDQDYHDVNCPAASGRDRSENRPNTIRCSTLSAAFTCSSSTSRCAASSRSRAFSARSSSTSRTSCRFAPSACASTFSGGASVPASASTSAATATEHSKHPRKPGITHPSRRVAPQSPRAQPPPRQTSEYSRINGPHQVHVSGAVRFCLRYGGYEPVPRELGEPPTAPVPHPATSHHGERASGHTQVDKAAAPSVLLTFRDAVLTVS